MVAGLGDLLSQQFLSCYHLLTTLKTDYFTQQGASSGGLHASGDLGIFPCFSQMRTVKW